MGMIEYTSADGYRGVMYGKHSLSVYKNGVELLHTGSRAINSPEELRQLVDNFPEFIEKIRRGVRNDTD